MARGYTVRLEAFEGPLDLLLHLVKTNEVDIYHLPIATITDQYLEYLDMFEELNLDVAGEYLVMAATLMYLKSRLLLPTDDEEEEAAADDPAVDLVRQLAEYQRYREAAEELRDRLVLGRDVFRREPSPVEAGEDEQQELRPVDLPTLFEALRRVLTQAVARAPHQLPGEEYRVADAVRSMIAALKRDGRRRFDELFTAGAPRGWIIASFVGLLELVRLGVIAAEQEGRAGTIYLRLIDADADEAVADLIESYGHGDRPADVA
ncbi:MAG: segregation/condensation protein A, partial [Deltaproteobacteria bacterium]